MAEYTFPNQRVITINREPARADFLGIKNENWQAAARDLGAHALMLYLYLAANADGYKLALSPAAISQAIGMPRSTYHDQFTKLINRGYLVEKSGNGYDFFEVPQSRIVYESKTQNSMSEDVHSFTECTSSDIDSAGTVKDVLAEDIEINNNIDSINTDGINNSILVPEVKEIIIKTPEVESPEIKRRREILSLVPKGEFIF